MLHAHVYHAPCSKLNVFVLAPQLAFLHLCILLLCHGSVSSWSSRLADLWPIPCRAPEQTDATSGCQGSHTDVWGFAATVLHMATGQLPYHGLTPHQVLASMIKQCPPAVPDVNPRWLQQLFKQCFAFDVAARPTVAQLLQVSFASSTKHIAAQCCQHKLTVQHIHHVLGKANCALMGPSAWKPRCGVCQAHCFLCRQCSVSIFWIHRVSRDAARHPGCGLPSGIRGRAGGRLGQTNTRLSRSATKHSHIVSAVPSIVQQHCVTQLPAHLCNNISCQAQVHLSNPVSVLAEDELV